MGCSIRRGSTPELTIEALGANLTDWELYVTLRHGRKSIELGPSRLSASYNEHSKTTYITATLTQEETLIWPEYAEVECQVHARLDDKRLESGIDTLQVRETLRDEILP